MAPRKEGQCISCQSKIRLGDSAVSILLFCRTVGIQQRQTSKTERLYICSQCATRLAMGSKPTNGAINVAVYSIIRELVGKDPGVIKAAWEELNETLTGGSPRLQLSPGEVLPPERAARPC